MTNDSYDMIDRFLRNNLDDADYAEYSKALDGVLAVMPAAPSDAVINYVPLYDFASRHRVPYNDLCATVRAALSQIMQPQAAPRAPSIHPAIESTLSALEAETDGGWTPDALKALEKLRVLMRMHGAQPSAEPAAGEQAGAVAWLLKIDGKPHTLEFFRGSIAPPEFGKWTWHALEYAAPGAAIAAREQEATLPPLSCKHSNRSDCGLFGMTEEPFNAKAGTMIDPTLRKTPRPSSEWYANKIQETLDDDFVIGSVAPQTDAELQALEREHMGDPDKKTGIYSPNYRIGWWLSGALEDPNTCEEMKADIRDWFASREEAPATPQAEPFGYIVDFEWGAANGKAYLYRHPDAEKGRTVPVYRAALTQPTTVQQAEGGDAAAEKLYTSFTDNHPTIHCNRFAPWSELGEAEKNTWRRKALKGVQPVERGEG